MAVNQETQAFRLERLKAAVARHGGEHALGKTLGWKDGAFVRQMVKGTRAISEKTVAQIETLKGMAGWFAQIEDEPLQLTPEERAVVLTFRQRLLELPRQDEDGRRYMRAVMDASRDSDPVDIGTGKKVRPGPPPHNRRSGDR